MAVTGASGHTVSLLAVTVVLVLGCSTGGEAAFNVFLELQGDCSDQLILICRHDVTRTGPLWIHNDTTEGGQVLAFAFPRMMYSFHNTTEHIVNVTAVDDVTALNGYVFQCVFGIGSTRIKSNAVQYTFIPNDYQPALSLASYKPDFSKRLSTSTYSFQESCSLYPRCTSYFSVEHTVSPLTVVTNTSSGCTVVYTISNLERCRTYHSTATALLGNQRGYTVIVGDTVMLSPGKFTITSVGIGVDRRFIDVTYEEDEPDCPGYPTERYTVDIDGVQVANLTADEFRSLTTNHSDGSVTLSLCLAKPLPENATTVNMTKFNTVPTDMSDDMGNIVTGNVTWGTSAVYDLKASSPPAGLWAILGCVFGVFGVFGGVMLLARFLRVRAIAIRYIVVKMKKWLEQRRTNELPLNAQDTDSLPETPEEIEDEQPEQTEFSNAEHAGGSQKRQLGRKDANVALQRGLPHSELEYPGHGNSPSNPLQNENNDMAIGDDHAL